MDNRALVRKLVRKLHRNDCRAIAVVYARSRPSFKKAIYRYVLASCRLHLHDRNKMDWFDCEIIECEWKKLDVEISQSRQKTLRIIAEHAVGNTPLLRCITKMPGVRSLVICRLVSVDRDNVVDYIYFRLHKAKAKKKMRDKKRGKTFRSILKAAIAVIILTALSLLAVGYTEVSEEERKLIWKELWKLVKLFWVGSF